MIKFFKQIKIYNIPTIDYLIMHTSRTPPVHWGRFTIDDKDNYKGSMSNIAEKNTNLSNHDHCGGELCKYPPTDKKI